LKEKDSDENDSLDPIYPAHNEKQLQALSYKVGLLDETSS